MGFINMKTDTFGLVDIKSGHFVIMSTKLLTLITGQFLPHSGQYLDAIRYKADKVSALSALLSERADGQRGVYIYPLSGPVSGFQHNLIREKEIK